MGVGHNLPGEASHDIRGTTTGSIPVSRETDSEKTLHRAACHREHVIVLKADGDGAKGEWAWIINDVNEVRPGARTAAHRPGRGAINLTGDDRRSKRGTDHGDKTENKLPHGTTPLGRLLHGPWCIPGLAR